MYTFEIEKYFYWNSIFVEKWNSQSIIVLNFVMSISTPMKKLLAQQLRVCYISRWARLLNNAVLIPLIFSELLVASFLFIAPLFSCWINTKISSTVMSTTITQKRQQNHRKSCLWKRKKKSVTALVNESSSQGWDHAKGKLLMSGGPFLFRHRFTTIVFVIAFWNRPSEIGGAGRININIWDNWARFFFSLL